MLILFKDDRLRRDCSQSRWMIRAFGERCARALRRRLAQLMASECLEHMRFAFHRRCHELRANHRGKISVDLDGGRRLLLEPANDPVPTHDDGSLDWSKVTAVRVMAVENTHA